MTQELIWKEFSEAPEWVVDLVQTRADERFSSANPDQCGSVASWICDAGRVVVVAVPGEEMLYSVCSEEDYKQFVEEDPLYMLRHDDLAPLEQVLELANIYGIDYIEQANRESDGIFVILSTRYEYGPKEITSVVTNDRGGVLSFDTFDEANAYVDRIMEEADSGENYLDVLGGSSRLSLRHAIQSDVLHPKRGLEALLDLRRHLDAPGMAWLEELWSLYPDSVVELSVYDRPVGIYGWRTVIWEVRNY